MRTLLRYRLLKLPVVLEILVFEDWKKKKKT